MGKTALLVIDVQNYFMNANTRHLPEQIAEHIRKSGYNTVIFTKFVNNNGSNFVRMLGWDKCHSPPDTDICAPLVPFARAGNTFEKSTLSAFKNPALGKYLDNNGVTKLLLCGTDSEACVLSSAFEAFDLGYDVSVIKELCASTNGQDFHASAKNIIERNLEPLPK